MKAGRLKIVCCVFAAFVCSVPLMAYDPPAGAVYVPSLTAPGTLVSSGNDTGTGTEAALDPSSSANPAWQAGARLKRLDAAYLGLTDWGVATQGWGSAASLSYTLPKAYGVWGFGLRFLSVPSAMTQLPLGTFGEGRVSFAKQVFSNLALGAGVSAQAGGNGSFGWGAGLDLGFRHDIGDAGFLKALSWGMSLSTIGKGFSYAIPSPVNGVFGTAATAITTPFTLGIEARGFLVRTENWRIGLGLGLSTPGFGDLDFKADLGIGYRDIFSLGVGWDAGLKDLRATTSRSLLPSVGLSVTIPLAGNGSPEAPGSITTSAAYAPLYGDVTAVGGGVGITFGKRDKSAPSVTLDLPGAPHETYYLSPNGDNVQDSLEIPVRVSDEGYLAGWSFRVEDKAAGKMIFHKEVERKLPDHLAGASSLAEGLGYVRASLPVPAKLVWNGYTDEGKRAPNGAYLVSFEAWDDEGRRNADYINCLTVVVDNDAPKVSVSGIDKNNIFSPDGDGIRESIQFRLGGSVEKLWKLDIQDKDGSVVRTEKWPNQSPPDFVWDGTDDKGTVVPDGTYSLHLSASKESGFAAAKTIEGIVVDTRRPAVAVELVGNIMSPNGDGKKDSIVIRPKLESKSGLEKFRVFVLDVDRKEVWSVSGTDPARLLDSYTFTGKDAAGKTLPDGLYEAGISLEYINGYSPQKFSPPILVDSTPPSAVLALNDPNRVFSPDGDGSRDSYAFSITGSKEDLWTLIMKNEAGDVVRTLEYRDSEPVEFVWDGRDDKGKVVPDGKYRLELSSTDKADNSARFVSEQVVVDNRRPALKMLIDWTDFSPNGDGIRDTVRLVPNLESRDGLVSWKVSVSDSSGREVWKVSGTDPAALKDKYDFDGMDPATGKLLPEGAYQAKTELVYASGYMPQASTPVFNLDATYPVVTLKADDPNIFFSPDGDGVRDSLSFAIKGSKEDLWSLEVRSEDNVLVRLVEFRDREPESFVWDGKDNFGKTLPDGTYTLTIASADKAGNASKPVSATVKIDTRKPVVTLSVDRDAFSPNGDGIKDTVTLSPKLEQKDGILSWKLWVRDLAGKDIWTVSGDGTALPAGAYVLDGKTDGTGAKVIWPEGEYKAGIELVYASGPSLKAETGSFVLDATYPAASVTEKEVGTVFSPDGDGVKDVKAYAITGTKEELWVLEIKDGAGQVVRLQEYRNASPEEFVWDGRDNTGKIAPDGSYVLELRSEDKAGNAVKLVSRAVKIDTRKPAVSVGVDKDAFSPNGDGIKDSLELTVKVPLREGLTKWSVRIVGKAGNTVWSREGSDPAGLADKYVLEGKISVAGASGAEVSQWPEGEYKAVMELSYDSGYEPKAETGWFLMDSVFPKATMEEKEPGAVFSPDGDGVRDVKGWTITGSVEELWTLEVKDKAGKVVRSVEYRNAKPEDFVWDGRDNVGKPASDGEYVVELRSADKAGNAVKLVSRTVKIDTRKPVVTLSVDRDAFSPNGDGIKDTVTLSPKLEQKDGILSWKLWVRDLAGKDIWTVSGDGTALPAGAYVLDGKTDGTGAKVIWPEGEYKAGIELVYASGPSLKAETGSFVLDATYPAASVTEKEVGTVFSPDGDGVKDVKAYAITGTKEELWVLEIKDGAGQVVRLQEYRNASPEEFVWDGRDNTGKIAPDGSYVLELRSEDKAGNAVKLVSRAVKIDTRKPAVSVGVDKDAFSPNGDGIKDSLELTVKVPLREGLTKWSVRIVGKAGNTVWSREGSDPAGLADKYVLEGKISVAGASGAEVSQWPEGEYKAVMELSYDSGYEPKAETGWFLMDSVFPKATMEEKEPGAVFSPDGDGVRDVKGWTITGSVEELWTLEVKDKAGKVVRSVEYRNAKPEDFVWDGRDNVGKPASDGEYVVELRSADKAGNAVKLVSRTVKIDTRKPVVTLSVDRDAFSPNGDGIKDTVTLSPKLEQKDGILSWKLWVRDLAGKDIWTVSGDGTALPAGAYVLDGKTDGTGAKVIWPEGEYKAGIELVYASGPSLKAETGSFVLDATYPAASVTEKEVGTVFSPDGDGVKDVKAYAITGTKEELWVLEIKDGAGQVVRLQEYRNASPEEFVWDGRDNTGKIAPDGSYVLELRSEDKAGNAVKLVSRAVKIDTRKPAVSVGVDKDAFSPNGDGIKDSLELTVKVPLREGLTKWSVRIVGKAGNTVWSREGSDPAGLADKYVLEGKISVAGASGAEVSQWPEGEYKAVMELSYDSGYEPKAETGWFLMDSVFPKATMEEKEPGAVFSPDGDGVRDVKGWTITGSVEELWTLEVKDKAGKVVRSVEYRNAKPEDFVWDGRDNVGKPASDGEYVVELRSADKAGNAVKLVSRTVKIDTRKPVVTLSVDRDAFSPNGDGIKDTVTLSPKLEQKDGILSWKLWVRDLAGKDIWTVSGDGTALPAGAYVLDGKTDGTGAKVIWPEGEYKAGIELVYASGPSLKAETGSFVLDATYPAASVTEKEVGTVFSPDGDGVKDVKAYAITGTKEELWVLEIKDGAGQVVRLQEYRNASPEEFVWDGRDNTGKIAPDGSYVLELRSEDKAGNAVKLVSRAVKIDTRKPAVSVGVDKDAFSPNGDGIKDSLELTVKVPLREGLTKWSVRIVGKAGNTVWSREGSDPAGLADKYVLEGKISVAGASGAEVSQWPEGEYKAVMELSYDSGYEPKAETGWFLMDSVFPKATMEEKEPGAVFSPDGDGVRDVKGWTITGSVEELWTLEVKDKAGKVVRSVEYRNAKPEDFVWDGRDNVGKPASDGEYVVELRSADKAGNAVKLVSRTVKIDTRKPVVTLSVDRDAFSPNGDGIKENLTVSVNVPLREGLTSWKLAVSDKSGKEMWSASGKDSSTLPGYIVLDSEHPEAGLVASWPDGEYLATLSLGYASGYAPSVRSPVFILDRKYPQASVSVDRTAFNPSGSVGQNLVRITQKGSAEETWNGEIQDSAGSSVRTWKFTGEPQAVLEWDGMDRNGKLLPDGMYSYVLKSTDRAGNSFSTAPIQIAVDTEKKTLILTSDRRAFSPNGDGVNETLTFTVRFRAAERIKSYELTVTPLGASASATSRTVRTWKGSSGLFETYVWDGLADDGSRMPDGSYVAKLVVVYQNDDRIEAVTPPLVIDTVRPSITVSVSPLIFSPNGDGRSDFVLFKQRSVVGDDWTGTITSLSGAEVRVWSWKSDAGDFIWDGKDRAGNILPDGTYTYRIVATDSAGNSCDSGPIAIQLENEKKAVTLSADKRAFSPNGDGVNDALSLLVQAATPTKVKSYELVISAQNVSGLSAGKTVRSWRGVDGLQSLYQWDGLTDEGLKAPDGMYSAKLSVLYKNDDKFDVTVSDLAMDRVVPSAKVSASLEIFSPNGDGRSDTVTYVQSSVPGDDWTGRMKDQAGKVVRSWVWKNELKDFVWDGKDAGGALLPDGIYSYEVSATDIAGNSFTAGPVTVRLETAKKAVTLSADKRAFSPNGDKVNDTLTLRVQAAMPEKIKSFELAVTAQAVTGVTPGMAVKSWKGKEGIQDLYVWDGLTDEGRKAPDGMYGAKLSVLYQNDDRFDVSVSGIAMDSVVPSATVSVGSEIFSPNGDGRSDTVTFSQSSVPGDDWTGVMKNETGKVVRSWAWKNELKDLVWDGKDQSGVLLPDGIYSYEVSATDIAGNSFTAGPVTVRLETEKKAVTLSADKKAFSPNGDKLNDTLTLLVQASTPARIKSWELVISAQNAQGLASGVVRSWKGSEDLQSRYEWDGMSDGKSAAPDGMYSAKLSVLYKNDDKFDVTVSGIAMDSVVPSATVSVASEIFSPNGDGRSDTVTFSQSSVPGDDWTGVMKNETGKVVRSWAWKNELKDFAWDGKDQNGILQPDGIYVYTVSATDIAGNSFTAGPLSVRLENEKKAVTLSADKRAFSPNGDGVNDALSLLVQAATPTKVKSYELVISAQNVSGLSAGKTVRSWKGVDGLQSLYQWDGLTDEGMKAPDGMYSAKLSVLYKNDDKFDVTVSDLAMDRVVPSAKVSASLEIFSPNGDGRSDTVTYVQSSVPGDDWTGRMKDQAGKVVRSWVWKNELKDFVWDGKDAGGALLPDGIYSYEVSATDIAGTASRRDR